MHLTDTRMVNRLFVSAFVSFCNLKVKNNKLIHDLIIKNSDDEFRFLKEFEAKICDLYSSTMTIEDIVSLFEFVISPADRIVTGAIYTPKNIREHIIHNCIKEMNSTQLQCIRIADISCGCGGFLVDATLALHNKTNQSFRNIYQNNIWGIDIQDYSVERTKILLSLLALMHGEDTNFDFNIYEADTLDYKNDGWNDKYSHFDLIIGNPPYVCSRKVDKFTKAKMMEYEVCQSGHPDLYIPFFQIATEMLSDQGKLGFITMNSFIRSVNGRAVREYYSKGKHNIYIVDFRGYQIFQRKSTYTCLFYLTKNQASEVLHYAVNSNGKLDEPQKYVKLYYKQLDNKKGWALNDFDAIRKIESIGMPIGKYCSSRHGIATLSNRTYIFKPIAEDTNYYYLKSGCESFPIEKTICRNIVNSNKLNSKVTFQDIIEKLIFPYKIQHGHAEIIDEGVMKATYPFAYTYLSHCREQLAKRDKGKTNRYPIWYAYGRTQSLIMPRYKLFFPKFANKALHCALIDDANIMLYNGVAFVSDNLERLQVLKCILESDIFWNYLTKNAKPYSTGYYSLSGVDIKNFGIPIFTQEDINALLTMQQHTEINKKLRELYN